MATAREAKVERLHSNISDFNPLRVLSNPRIIERAPQWMHEVDWDDMYDHPLDDDLVHVAKYMFDVESHTPTYRLFSLLNRSMHADPEVTVGGAVWELDEFYHGLSVYGLLAARAKKKGEAILSLADSRRTELDKHDKHGQIISPLKAILLNLTGSRPAGAVVTTFGVINEGTTAVGYRALSHASGSPAINHLLRSCIAPEEAVHGGDYRRQAAPLWQEMHDNHPIEHKIGKYTLVKSWKLVGDGYRPSEEANRVLKSMSEAPNFAEDVNRIDRQVSRFAGLDETHLVAEFVDQALDSAA